MDTGSPFITVTSSCSEQWGCYRGEGRPVGLSPTYEVFAGSEGPVAWKGFDVAIPNLDGISGLFEDSSDSLSKDSGLLVCLESQTANVIAGPQIAFKVI